MEKLLSEMKMEIKYNQIIKKEDLDIEMEYTGKKILLTFHFKDEMVDLLSAKRFDPKEADCEKKLKN